MLGTEDQPAHSAGKSSPKLAAVVFTDVVGYSARMQRDEAATIAQVEADFARMRELCAQHRGEVLNTMGDGMMICFASAVQAVAFALEAQSEFGQRNAELAEGEGLQHRIGIHLGDVFRTEGGHVAGDGVNIAARLESSAPHGGVCVSQTVYDTVKGKLPMEAEFIGPRSFKNIAEPIPIWHLRSGVAGVAGVAGSSASTRPAPLEAPKTRPAVSRRLVIGGTTAAVALGAVGAGLWLRRGDGTPAAGAAMASDAKSIAVLPFTNMSADKDGSYFADGIHEDLLTQLALLSDLKVVSRTSVMEYRNTARNMRQIGSELRVGSLVEGSVRRAGDQVRVTAQLIDAHTDKHIWAANYDRQLKDIFAVQSDVATEIARALRVSLSPPEQTRLASKPTENLEAYDLFLRHQELVNRVAGSVGGLSTVPERIALLSKAVELDPKFALAWAKLASERGRSRGYGIDTSAAMVKAAGDAMQRALALAPNDPLVKIEEGAFYLHAMDDHARSLQAFNAVLAVAPNNVTALAGLAQVQGERLEFPPAVAALEKALEVDARNAANHVQLSNIYLRFRHYDRALALRRRVAELRPDDLDAKASLLMMTYWSNGSWEPYDQWRRTLPAGVEKKSARVRNTDADRAIARRDLAEVLRLIDIDTDDLKAVTTPTDQVHSAIDRALALFTLGNKTAGLDAARAVLPKVEAEIKRDSDSRNLFSGKALMLAMLGRREAAIEAYERSYAIAKQSVNARQLPQARQRLTYVLALLGERDAAIANLRERVKEPSTYIHDLNVALGLAPLWDDPEFKAIVADPASNAPLPLTMKM